MWIASARYALVFEYSVQSWVHGCLFQIRAWRNTRGGFCWTCVEQPSCHSPETEVAHGLYPQSWASQLTGTSPYSLIQK